MSSRIVEALSSFEWKEHDDHRKTLEDFARNLKNPDFRKQYLSEAENRLNQSTEKFKAMQQDLLSSWGIAIFSEKNLSLHLKVLGVSESEIEKLKKQFNEFPPKSKLILTKMGETFLISPGRSQGSDGDIQLLASIALDQTFEKHQQAMNAIQKLRNLSEVDNQKLDAEIDKFITEIQSKMK